MSAAALRAIIAHPAASPEIIALARAALPKAKVIALVSPGEAFATALGDAKRAAISEHGERWYLVPGASQWVRLPTRLTSYTFMRADGSQSSTIRMPRDQRVPAPRFWANGVLPDGLILEQPIVNDPVRAQRTIQQSAFLDYRHYLVRALAAPKGRRRIVSDTESEEGRKARRAAVQRAWQNRRVWRGEG